MSHLTHPNHGEGLPVRRARASGSLYIVMEHLEGKNLNQMVRTEGPLPVERARARLDPGVRRARRGASSGDRSSRSQAREHLSLHQRRPHGLPEGPRFRPRQGDRARASAGLDHADARGHGRRVAGIHVAGAGAGQDARRAGEIPARRDPLREVLTGKLPFEARTPMEYIHPRHQAADPARPASRGQDVSGRARRGVARALEKKPEGRYESGGPSSPTR